MFQASVTKKLKPEISIDAKGDNVNLERLSMSALQQYKGR